MLRVIEPSSHEFYQSKIDELLYLFKVYQSLELSLEEQARTTFIIAENPRCSIYGGALLRKKPVYTVEEELEAVISTLYSYRRKVWSANICFSPEEDGFGDYNKEELFEEFQRSLFKKFIHFGKKEKTSFLILSLYARGYFRTRIDRLWTTLLQVSPEDSVDGLFHALLPLRPLKNKRPINVKRSLSRVHQGKEASL